MTLRGAAAVVGVAELAPRRYTEGETHLGLLAKVGADAIADSGIPFDQIDGLIVPPVGGVSMVAPATVAEYMGVRPRFAELVDLGGATGAGMVWRAAAAIATGMCTTCLCVTAAKRERRLPGEGGSGNGGGSRRPHRERSPASEFEAPYGAAAANAAYAMIAMRYQHEFNLSPEQRARIAVAQRANACANPAAMFHGQPITVDDVLASEVIADPLHLLEIVMPVAGGAALVVTAADRAIDLPHGPAWVIGAGENVTHTALPWAPSLTDTAVAAAAESAFTMAEVKPGDIGLASLYDCYTIAVALTLEDAGFCAKGEAGAFIDAHDLRWSGDFPLNSHGGQLSFGQAGIAGGMSHVTEAVLQLQRRADGRQVPDLELAYVNGNGGFMSEQVGLVLGTSR